MWTFQYYLYKSEYGSDPIDLEELFDGLNVYTAKQKLMYPGGAK